MSLTGDVNDQNFAFDGGIYIPPNSKRRSAPAPRRTIDHAVIHVLSTIFCTMFSTSACGLRHHQPPSEGPRETATADDKRRMRNGGKRQKGRQRQGRELGEAQGTSGEWPRGNGDGRVTADGQNATGRLASPTCAESCRAAPKGPGSPNDRRQSTREPVELWRPWARVDWLRQLATINGNRQRHSSRGRASGFIELWRQGHNDNASTATGGYSAANLYPKLRTVMIRCGSFGSSSIRLRRFDMCVSTRCGSYCR